MGNSKSTIPIINHDLKSMIDNDISINITLPKYSTSSFETKVHYGGITISHFDQNNNIDFTILSCVKPEWNDCSISCKGFELSDFVRDDKNIFSDPKIVKDFWSDYKEKSLTGEMFVTRGKIMCANIQSLTRQIPGMCWGYTEKTIHILDLTLKEDDGEHKYTLISNHVFVRMNGESGKLLSFGLCNSDPSW